MYEATLRLEVKDPELIKKSLEPDIKSGEDIKVSIRTSKKTITVSYTHLTLPTKA